MWGQPRGRSGGRENPNHGGAVHITAAQDHAGASFAPPRAAEQRRHPQRGARFNHQFQVIKEETHRLHDRFFRDGAEIVHVLQDDREGEFAERTRAGAVGDGEAVLHRLQRAGAERTGGVVAQGRFHANHAA